MRNSGTPDEHRAAFDLYRETAAEHGRAATAGNLMIERFVAIGHDERDIERQVDRLTSAFGKFLNVCFTDGRRPVPTNDGEFQTASDAPESTLEDTGASQRTNPGHGRPCMRLSACPHHPRAATPAGQPSTRQLVHQRSRVFVEHERRGLSRAP